MDKYTESKQMLIEADRTGAVKIMVPVDELRSLLQVIEEQKKALEWASFIVGSSLDMGYQLRYDPKKWIVEYHEKWK